jgi:hypothetical protein
MATKSVIEIDILDEKFKSFQAQFEKYKKALEKMPKDWEKINKGISLAEKAQKDFNKAISDGYGKLKNVATVTGTIASNMASAAVSIAKWVALGAIGGGFGLGGIAASASSLRRTAGGLGVSAGALTSARTYLSPYLDADTVLSNIAALRTSPQGQAVLSKLGGRTGQTTEEVLPNVLRSAVQQFRQFKGNEAILGQLGATKIADMETLRRLSGLQGKEFEDALKQYSEGIKKFSIADQDLRNWQNFWTRLRESGNVLEKSLIKNLLPLSEAFNKLSKSVADAIDHFLSSKNFAKFVDGASEAIKKFGDYLASPEFEENVKTFLEALKRLGDAAYSTAKFLGLIDKSKEEKEKEKAAATDINILRKEITGTNQSAIDRAKEYLKSRPFITDNRPISERNLNPGNLRAWGNAPIVGGFAKFGSEEEGLRAMARQLQIYQTRDKLNTIQEIIKKYAPPNENVTSKYIENVASRTGFAATQELNLSDVGTLSKLMSAMTKQENFRSTFTPEYIQKIIINNETGGSAIVTSQAVTPTPAGR